MPCHTIIVEGLSSVPHNHMWQLAMACSSSSEASSAFGLRGHLHSCAHTHTEKHTHAGKHLNVQSFSVQHESHVLAIFILGNGMKRQLSVEMGAQRRT